MQSRIYVFMAGVEQAAQPDAGTPTDPNDIVPLSYFGTLVEQESVSGTRDNSNTDFTVAHTPLSHWPFELFVNGVLLKAGVDYTRSGVNITIAGGLDTTQVPTATYRY